MKDLIEYLTTAGNIGSFLLAISMLAAGVVVLEKLYTWAARRLKKYYDFKRGKEIDKENDEKQSKHLTELDAKLDTLINALITSGINTKEFVFLGFLPVNAKEKKSKLED